jgi:hypothetical protein
VARLIDRDIKIIYNDKKIKLNVTDFHSVALALERRVADKLIRLAA